MAIDTQAPEVITNQQGNELTGTAVRTPTELAKIVETTALSDEWLRSVRLCADRRWYERLYHSLEYDIWVISWMPGQSTGFHDHGASSGAFVVKTGVLEELRPSGSTNLMKQGQSRSFDANYAHDVRNVSDAPAISIHAYSPPLTEMNEYEVDGGELVPRPARQKEAKASRNSSVEMPEEPGDSRIEVVLAAARARLRRKSARNAFEALKDADTVLVDIRPAGQRAMEGSIPGALIVERNVLEWRFDPSCAARLPIADNPNLQVILFCSQGYASSIAAADLQTIGLWRATDVIGGFQAWQAEGLPTELRTEIAANL